MPSARRQFGPERGVSVIINVAVGVTLRRTQCEQMFSGLPLKADIAQYGQHVSKVPLSDSCTAAKAPYWITSSACAGNAAHRLSRRGGAGGAPRVEALARIIPSNAPIAVRGMKRTSTRSRATSSTKPPPREPALRQSAGRQRRLCREASAAVLRLGPPFRNRSSVCRSPEIGTHAATPTMLPIRI